MLENIPERQSHNAERSGIPAGTLNSIVGGVVTGFVVLCRLGWLARKFWHNIGDISSDFLDLVLASGGDHVAGCGLGGEQRGPCDLDLCLGARPFATVEGLHCELDDEPVRRNVPLLRGVFDTIPLPGRDPDVLLQCPCHQFRQPFRALRTQPGPETPNIPCTAPVENPVRGPQSSQTRPSAKIPDW